MKSIGIKIGAGYLLAVALLVILGAASFRSVNRLQESAHWVNHTNEVLLMLGQMMQHMVDAETGERGYVITGEERSLEPYQHAITEAEKDIQKLRTLTSDNPVQQANIATLEPLIRESLTVLNEVVGHRRSGDFAAAQAIIKADKGKRVMDRIRLVVAEMSRTETELLTERSETERLAISNFKQGVLFGIGFAILFLAAACYLITANIVRPLARLTAVATEISRGEIGARIELTNRNDEIGVLAEAFDRMGGYLAAMAETARRITAGELATVVEARPQRQWP